MKHFLILIAIFSLVACSSDDDNSSNNNEISQNLLGKWYFEDPTTNPTYNNSFTFTADGNVVYSYWDGTPGNNYDSETGTFSVEGDILTMVYPETVVLTFIQKVVFISENEVEFQDTGVAGEEAYEGTYYKE